MLVSCYDVFVCVLCLGMRACIPAERTHTHSMNMCAHHQAQTESRHTHVFPSCCRQDKCIWQRCFSPFDRCFCFCNQILKTFFFRHSPVVLCTFGSLLFVCFVLSGVSCFFALNIGDSSLNIGNFVFPIIHGSQGGFCIRHKALGYGFEFLLRCHILHIGFSDPRSVHPLRVMG